MRRWPDHVAMLSTDPALKGWLRGWGKSRRQPGHWLRGRLDWVMAPSPKTGAVPLWTVAQMVEYVPLEWSDRVFVLRRHSERDV